MGVAVAEKGYWGWRKGVSLYAQQGLTRCFRPLIVMFCFVFRAFQLIVTFRVRRVS